MHSAFHKRLAHALWSAHRPRDSTGTFVKLGARFKCVQIEDTQQERAQFIIEEKLSTF